MKFGKYLIVSLPDFRRHFDFMQFYKNRHQFVRDMHPDKVYYWDANLINAYKVIANWIKSSDNPLSEEMPKGVANAFMALTGKTDISNIVENSKGDNLSLSEEVIKLSPDQDVSLPVYKPSESNAKINIKLHKIVAHEETTALSTIYIGRQHRELSAGEIVYVTESSGGFIEFLPNQLENEFFRAELIDIPNQLDSILEIEDKKSGNTSRIMNILGFALTEFGCISINSDYELDYGGMGNKIPLYMLEDENLEIYPIEIKSEDRTSIGVLYNDGSLRTTISDTKQEGVFTFVLDERNIITNSIKQ